MELTLQETQTLIKQTERLKEQDFGQCNKTDSKTFTVSFTETVKHYDWFQRCPRDKFKLVGHISMDVTFELRTEWCKATNYWKDFQTEVFQKGK